MRARGAGQNLAGPGFRAGRALSGLVFVAVHLAVATGAFAQALQIGSIQASPAGTVTQYEKIEITFVIGGSTASEMQWPYDLAPPNGVEPGVGITVNAVFTDPNGRRFQQPAFHREQFVTEAREGRDWHLPTGRFAWVVRFSPNLPGVWRYTLMATDRGGTTESEARTFTVAASARHGFVRVSAADPRYFEFDDGTLFDGVGFELPGFLGNPATAGAAAYEALGRYGVNFVRVWISSIYGSAWSSWVGGRNQYRGYLPITGLTPLRDDATGQTTLTMKLDYEPEGDTGWFDACRMQVWWEDEAESIEPQSWYRIRVEYRGFGITGPRDPAAGAYGLVAKIGGWHPDCHQPGTSAPVTGYGGDNAAFGAIEGRWFSGGESFLPRLYLALENVSQGAAYVRSVSLRKDLGGGQLGPELMIQPSMAHQRYIPEEKAHAFDAIVEQAERHGVYLKLVLMDANDAIYQKMADDGGWVTTADNADGFYGLGRDVNQTRWLQQMWWRYLQARWGYSTSIHSWELTNEGDPSLVAHYELADELGKFMHCRVFGVEPGSGDGARCSARHPNAHLVTTSFWHGFPAAEFWKNAKYPNVDYADLHAYVSTSYAPLAERQAMRWDAAHYRVWHSQDLAGLRVGKPVVRGEAGLDETDRQDETVLGIGRDITGVWLHNHLWSGLDAGGLYELYWWTSHIWNASFDHRHAYRAFRSFLAGVPLNQGGFTAWGGSTTNPQFRVVGQKNAARGALVLWVQNRQHTWKNVVDGVSVAPASGEVVVAGFEPGAAFSLERWDTYAAGGRVVSTEAVTADSTGRVRITIDSLRTDVALRIRGTSGRPSAPAGFRVAK